MEDSIRFGIHDDGNDINDKLWNLFVELARKEIIIENGDERAYVGDDFKVTMKVEYIPEDK
jgi:hypothetical protein